MTLVGADLRAARREQRPLGVCLSLERPARRSGPSYPPRKSGRLGTRLPTDSVRYEASAFELRLSCEGRGWLLASPHGSSLQLPQFR